MNEETIDTLISLIKKNGICARGILIYSITKCKECKLSSKCWDISTQYNRVKFEKTRFNRIRAAKIKLAKEMLI